ncbi:hypothetical protein ACH4Q7_22480 [Streptomyces roseolus]|uniref:hypothetical protein n=1 Tax=Streptomyces roseolus TaxID=67358 RepID=UPI00379510F1
MNPPHHDQDVPAVDAARLRDGLAHHCERAEEAEAGHAVALANLANVQAHSLNTQHDYHHALTDVYAMQGVRRLLALWETHTLEPGQVRRLLGELRATIGTRDACRGRGKCRWMEPDGTDRERAQRGEAAIERVRTAAHIADDRDVTDWQRGYRAAVTRILAALDADPRDDLAGFLAADCPEDRGSPFGWDDDHPATH